MTLTLLEAENRYREGMKALTDKYGPFRIPWGEYMEVSERLRAFHIVHSQGGSVTAKVLSQYMVSSRIATEILSEMGMDDVSIETGYRQSRADQYKAFEKWASEHDSEQFTTEQLVEASGFSYPTTLKFIDASPFFLKVKKGLYECRDEKMRREQALKGH